MICLATNSHWRFPMIGRELNFEPRYSGTKRWTPRATSRSGALERWKRDTGIAQYNTRDPRDASASATRSGTLNTSQSHVENTTASRRWSFLPLDAQLRV